MNQEELDYEITETIKVIKELELTGEPGALKLAMDDLKSLAILKEQTKAKEPIYLDHHVRCYLYYTAAVSAGLIKPYIKEDWK